LPIKSKVSFDRIDLLLVSPKTQNNGSLRQSLSDLEFREIRLGSELSDIVQALETRAPDLLITDGDLPDGDVCELIADLRHGRIGSDPFMPTIVTTWKPSTELVNKVVNCGADDLLVQPASRGQLGARVDALTFRRKPFVVTASYIGPDRRKDARPGENSAELIDVPNLLHAKATGEGNIIAIQQNIYRLRGQLNHSKLRSNAEFVTQLIDSLIKKIPGQEAGATRSDRLNELAVAAQDIAWRVTNTRFAHVSKLAKAVIQVAHRLQAEGGQPAERDIKLLPQLALSIKLAFEDSNAAAAAEKISRAISDGSPDATGTQG
jgi:response regulator RpfG family c-di-GMP phosphodiesterase